MRSIAALIVMSLALVPLTAECAELVMSDNSISSGYCLITFADTGSGYELTYDDSSDRKGEVTFIFEGGIKGDDVVVTMDDITITGTFKRSTCSVTFIDVQEGIHHLWIVSSGYDGLMISASPEGQDYTAIWHD